MGVNATKSATERFLEVDFIQKLKSVRTRSAADVDILKDKAIQLLDSSDKKLIAHYYVDSDIQDIALKTGGCVADSLQMANFGRKSDASVLLIAGVRFMAETAKALSPEKMVFPVSNNAECSLDLSCPAQDLKKLMQQHPDRKLVVYANTSIEVKALADWIVTSANVLEVMEHLSELGEKVIWAPDKHMGRWIQSRVDIDMINWDGACVVHEEFKLEGLLDMRKVYPDAKVLAHPESPIAVLDSADFVGSTSNIIKYAENSSAKTLIIATDEGLFYMINRKVKEKHLVLAPTAGVGASCVSCGRCPWMQLNNLELLVQQLEQPANEIQVDKSLLHKAKHTLDKMLEFSFKRN